MTWQYSVRVLLLERDSNSVQNQHLWQDVAYQDTPLTLPPLTDDEIYTLMVQVFTNATVSDQKPNLPDRSILLDTLHQVDNEHSRPLVAFRALLHSS